MNSSTIRENYMQNAAETRNTIIARKRYKFYNNSQNTDFITCSVILCSASYEDSLSKIEWHRGSNQSVEKSHHVSWNCMRQVLHFHSDKWTVCMIINEFIYQYMEGKNHTLDLHQIHLLTYFINKTKTAYVPLGILANGT